MLSGKKHEFTETVIISRSLEGHEKEKKFVIIISCNHANVNFRYTCDINRKVWSKVRICISIVAGFLVTLSKII